jgi:gliding motility-associated-like protein
MGTFIPSNTVLNAQYIPAASEIAAGEVILTLTSTGNGSCLPSTDQVKITFNPSPIAFANIDQTVCANNNVVTLNGQISNAGGGLWSGGLGMFTPNNSILNATYTPSQTEINNGYATLILTTTGNGVCLSVSDTVYIYYTPAPVADAGIDFTVCNNNPVAQLNGNVTIASGGIWSGNGGSFVPDATSFNAQYVPTQSEILSGLFSLTLTSTGNGTCNAVSDQVQIFITQAPLVVAGQDQTICVDALTVNLNGYIGGITTTGQWSSTGTGTFVPNPNALNASYLASSADSANGSVNLVLTSTNNGLCNPVTDTLLVTILPAGYSNAGSDVTVCANNSVIFLNGQVSGGAASGYWTTTGSGVFVPNAQALNASYIPSSGDNAMGSVNLILTANSCNIAKDTLIVTITPAPVVDAGNDITVCVDQLDIQLDGLVSGGTTTGIWVSSGTGTFSPDNTAFDAIYHASSQDSVSQHVTLVLLSTNNGNCFGVSDTMLINILHAGIVNAGFDQIYCSNNSNVQLNGQISGGASQGLWSTSGSGYFIPNATSLNATYVSSSADTAAGSVTLALVATDACNFAMDIIQINFSDAPTVYAGTDQTVCANNSLVNLNGSISVAAGGIWSTSGTGTFLPDNISLNAQYQPSQNDILNGSIDIILTSTGNGSCNSVKDTVTISFSPSPVVNAGVNQSVCTSAGSTNLNGFVGSGASQGIWTTLGDGTFNPSNNIFAPEYIFGPSEISIGFVNLILTSFDNGNCNAVTDTMLITFGSSVFVFAGNDQQICSTTSGVNLSGFVAGGSTTGIWTTSGSGSFNPGNTSLNAVYIFSSTDSLNGGADLILTSTNNGGCTAGIDTMHFTINYPSSVNTGPDMNICSTETETLLSVSVTGGATAGIWTTSGDGVFTPSADILSPDYYFGTNDIALGSTNIIFTTSDHGACPAGKDSLMIYFWEPNIVDAGNDQNVCVTYPSIDLTGSVSGGTSTGIWSSNGTGSFVPGNTTLINSYIFSAADSINGSVELILTSTGNPGCSTIADTVDIYLFPLPVINAGNDFSVCTGIDSISIAGTILNGTGGIWTTNGTGTFYPNDSALNAEYIPSQSDFLTGSVVLTLTSTGAMYCPNLSDNITITFTTPLIPAFSYTTPCLNGSVTFTDLTQILSGTISGWLWTFDGMNPDLNQNPDYVFNTSGIHNVSLTVTSSLGCSYSITNNVFVNPLPDVSFSFTTQCYFDSVSFTDLSTVSPGGINNWSWDFGDTTYSNSQNPVHYFSTPGTYAVSLTVVSDSTCSSDVTLNVEVLSAPEAQYTFQYDCQNHNMSFTDQSDNNGNTISGWSWDFDNGSQDFTQNPLSHFTDTGSYDVQFIIFASQNCSDTIVQTVNIYDVEADFSFTNVCVYDSIIFTDNSEFNQGSVQQWEWDFGDDETSYVQNPAHLYQTSGDYNVTLIVVTADGCHDTITQTVSPKPVPVAGFNIVSEDYMVNKPVSFNDISTGATSYTWDFGDGTGISTNASSVYTYTVSGTYEVYQAVMNEYNCVDTAFQNIIIIGDDEVYGPVLPTGFTPNGDGENDSLYVRGGPFKLLLFRIYNEWGQMIFETESPDLGWDGMRNGVLQPMGVYVYTVKATTITDKEYSISGEVTLIR